MEKNSQESIQVQWGDHTVNLTFNSLDFNIDVDDLIRIDSSNPVGEMLTISTLLNKCGIMRSQAEYEMKMAELQVKTVTAELEPEVTKSLIKFIGEGEKRKAKHPAIPQVEQALNRHTKIIELKKRHLMKERDFNLLDNLYWACKSKDSKVASFFHKIVPDGYDSEIIQGVVNGIDIKKLA
jgi:hypothetical protein